MKHATYPYILDPTHEITVNVIGVGGTGSQVLNILARMHVALKALGHPGFHVTAFDGDSVSESNIGRQSFWEGDVGDNKAENLITKVNLAFGLNWDAATVHFERPWISQAYSNIYISCTDTIKSREEIYQHIKEYSKNNYRQIPYTEPYYWLDFGNSSSSGQVILSTKDGRLRNAFQLYPESMTEENESDEPSCSMQEALARQDLLINSTLANLGMHLFWQLFKNLGVEYQGLFLNLSDFSISKIPIKE